MWIQNGPDDEMNSIEVGWAVYPELFGDNLTRLFTYWTADGYQSTGCFNFLCKGFIQIHDNMTLGDPIDPNDPRMIVTGNYADPDNPRMPISVYRSEVSGNWWLFIGEERIGYWPRELWTHLAHDASFVRFGGMAGATSGSPSPPMGKGNLPAGKSGMENSGWMSQLMVYNESLIPVYFDFDRAFKRHDTWESCYDIQFLWFSDIPYYNVLEYGGPGGSHCEGDPVCKSWFSGHYEYCD
ncbi:hypothetical protein MKW94_016081 [Papaver nudicaule]|uniref:Neprosin PEP catalytic domain-containing protein n=1 Tax=Papaver nudicaule TaxID=74823 RepID=A0AA41VHD6_PAPNU|nr:hypothetical protein [Papaver nudicaule]